MKVNGSISLSKCVVLSLLLSGLPLVTLAQTSAFTYQGRLNIDGAPANGLYDFSFRLMDDPTNGTAAPVIPLNLAVPVTNGLFTTAMDFGAENFSGSNLWLEISVRANGGGAFTVLTPRQLLTSTPYAIRSLQLGGTVGAASLSGTYTNAVSFNNAANHFSGDGASVTGLSAANVSSGTLSDARLSSNVALRSGGNAFSGKQTVTNGTVGIGLVNPLATLHVSSSATAPQLQINQANTNDFTRMRMGVSGWPFWEIDVAPGATPLLEFWNSTLRMVLNYDGWLGIGTSAPASPLHVASTGNTPQVQITQYANNDYTRLRMNVSGSPSWEMDVSSGATPSLSFWNSTLRMLMDYSGNLGIGTGSPDSRLHVVSGGVPPQLHLNQTTSGNYARAYLTVNDGVPWSIGVSDSGSTPGNLEFNTESGAAKMRIDRAGNVYSIMGFNGSSDRNAKENFKPVDPRTVLDKVTALSLTRWNFKADPATTHLGPMAQDFYAAFHVGPDDKHIATVDADGVALAAIQGLNQKVETEAAALRAENAELKRANQQLERRLEAIEKSLLNH